MKPIELTSSNFEETVQNTDLPVLVDFHATWCGPCKMLSPIVDQVAEAKDGQAVVAKVDIDEARDIAQKFQITSVPTLMVFHKGEVVTTKRGVQSKANIEAMLDAAAATA
ncbi:MAG: thioredoxin [Verrucomicrobiales bacterium]|nr:thioredoxin [Verrucomicrobiales bacterium]